MIKVVEDLSCFRSNITTWLFMSFWSFISSVTCYRNIFIHLGIYLFEKLTKKLFNGLTQMLPLFIINNYLPEIRIYVQVSKYKKLKYNTYNLKL